MARDRIRIGTRGSRLALWQADHVAARLAKAHPGLEPKRVVIRTTGDRVLDTALSRIGDKGLFTRELESALHEERIDVAVHSLKDLPTDMPGGLGIAAVLEREDPRDALVARDGLELAALPAGSRVGTSSLRRRAQLLALRPDLEIADLRGNVPTRIEKVQRGDVTAAVLARAGLVRLGLEGHVSQVLEPEQVLSAVGQGAVAVQSRAEDADTRRLLAPLDHGLTRLAVTAERSLLARLEGGCQVPVGALATIDGQRTRLRAIVASVDGRDVVRGEESAETPDLASAEALGVRLAERLLEDGADEILTRTRAAIAEGAR